MTQAKTVTGTVARVERNGHTYYGNPIINIGLEVTAIDGISAESATLVTIRISDNASLVYEIANPEYRNEPHAFELTRAGRISGKVVR